MRKPIANLGIDLPQISQITISKRLRPRAARARREFVAFGDRFETVGHVGLANQESIASEMNFDTAFRYRSWPELRWDSK